jgi:hypothetical protein
MKGEAVQAGQDVYTYIEYESDGKIQARKQDTKERRRDKKGKMKRSR